LLWRANEKLQKGSNTILISEAQSWPNGSYLLHVQKQASVTDLKFLINR